MRRSTQITSNSICASTVSNAAARYSSRLLSNEHVVELGCQLLAPLQTDQLSKIRLCGRPLERSISMSSCTDLGNDEEHSDKQRRASRDEADEHLLRVVVDNALAKAVFSLAERFA